MRAIADLAALDAELALPGLRLVYVSLPGCSICEVLRPKVAAIAESVPGVSMASVDAAEAPDVASRLSVLAAPVVLIFAEGKEVLREGRFLREGDFEAALRRYAELMGLL